MSAALQPQEIARRHQAVMAAYWSSRGGQDRVDAGAMAGVISTPVAPKNPPRVSYDKFAPPVATPAAVLLVAGVRTIVDYGAAQRWAIARGVSRRGQPLDLYAVNDLRRRLGFPLFALKGDI